MASQFGDVAEFSKESSLERLRLTNVTTTGKVIGKGAYGRVIEVYVHGTLCAAKEVHPILLDHVTPRVFEVTKQSFLTECVNTSRILHPNVVQVLGVYYSTRQAKLPWLVMEMMETSLKIFLEKYEEDKVPFHFKLSILVGISQGLEFLHGQDIIHRDLSSNNVLLTKHFVAKIADLGVAKVIEHNRMKTQTQTPGTLHFMPPEALSVRPRYGKPVDVFSLACIALHMVSHQWPEPKDRVQEDPVTYEMRALKEVERREHYLQWSTPESLKRLVKSCLNNQPDCRPAISCVREELKKLKNSVDKQIPFAIADPVQMFDVVQQGQLQIKKLHNEIDTMNHTNNSLQRELQEVKFQMQNLEQIAIEKDKKIKELIAKTEQQSMTAVNQSEKVFKQYQELLSVQNHFSQAMNQLERKQKEDQGRQAKGNQAVVVAIVEKNLLPNEQEFECGICFTPIEVGEGVKLRDCSHNICKECLHDWIMMADDANVQCPCNEEFECKGMITELEMKSILSDEEFAKLFSRESHPAENYSYHCKTPNCRGWCVYEDELNVFSCMVCGRENCILCKAIHTPMTCKEYQVDLMIKATNDEAAQETKQMLKELVKNGKAMYCPNKKCGIIIQERPPCDWIRCSCQIEICWVTKGPRWGPKGRGDTSGGCRCRVGGKKCHPNCRNCH